MHAPQAVIEIGSTGIRLLVAESVENSQSSKFKFNILDRSEQRINIGRDVFTNGEISRDTLLLCIKILKNFAEQLSSWGITTSETTVFATSAVREAKNRDPFVDQINIKTGFTVQVTDGIKENQLIYLALSDCLEDKNINFRHRDSIIIDISGGSTEMMLLEKGKIVAAHSIRLGTIIIEQEIHSIMGNLDDTKRLVTEFIHNTGQALNVEMNFAKIKQFIALGNDMKIASLFIGKPISQFIWEIQKDDFINFVNEIQTFTIEECMAKFKFNYDDAQSFQIALIAYLQFLLLTDVKSIIVPETSVREGLLLSKFGMTQNLSNENFSNQILASAKSLLKKYQGDEKHADYVCNTSLKIYDSLQDELGFDIKARNLLAISSILHDIGMFIHANNHNLHSKYIITHSEIFGLTKEEKSIVAMIANFHKGSKMPQNDNEFKFLPRSYRMIVLKLSAILRVADALDRGHKQNLTDFTITRNQDSFTIRIRGHKNLTLEKIAITQKGDLFENIFGYKIVLV